MTEYSSIKLRPWTIDRVDSSTGQTHDKDQILNTVKVKIGKKENIKIY